MIHALAQLINLCQNEVINMSNPNIERFDSLFHDKRRFWKHHEMANANAVEQKKTENSTKIQKNKFNLLIEILY